MPRRRKPARLFQRRDDGAWVIIDEGKHIRTGYGEGFLRQAEEELSRYLVQKVTRNIKTNDIREISVGQILTLYGEDRIDRVKDPERLKNSIKALAPFWANLTVADVNHERCVQYCRWRNRSDSTMRREMGTLNAALKFAAARNLIPYAPPVTLPPKGIAKDRWLTKSEVAKLLKNAPPHVERFIRIGLATGRRKTAILRLRWVQSEDCGWVDLDRGVIHFLGTKEQETKKRKGIVKIPNKLLEDMRTWDQRSEFVINYDGQPIKDIKTAFRATVRRAGLNNVTPHTLKHTAVTWAFANGMTIEMATEYFATTRETLENVYRSHSPNAQKEAAAIMDACFTVSDQAEPNPTIRTRPIS